MEKPRDETPKRLVHHRLYHDELPEEHEDPLIRQLHRIIRGAVKVLAVLMVLVIIWGVIDVVYMLYTRLVSPPFLLFEVSDIFAIFSAFMVVLIAIEIFINIRLYLGTNMLPIQLVIATALMAIARKVIIMDTETVSSMEIMAIAAVVLALGITHWLVARKP
ncbi:phosphate-starvation-inducible PsiE family protein [Billgrantia diversa]|uniref:phosphate-starvation-inducible PsiE family protein n=1 Tax=Halomonas sp. MCCC 1A13316 TaxID=2733487 RepID=UPI0018A47019|nr:phosphate-starvation-inducible PsiE family protein [Halomonas sp. MCCC 1A13316]QOR38079.1 phosphate-starvation-inducible PsiE family protein [Halomonas sp. MCCC 1A13316]